MFWSGLELRLFCRLFLTGLPIVLIISSFRESDPGSPHELPPRLSSWLGAAVEMHNDDDDAFGTPFTNADIHCWI